MNWNEITYWNSNAYGTAVVIPTQAIMIPVCIFCFITPFTNWLIPIIYKIVKPIRIRYE